MWALIRGGVVESIVHGVKPELEDGQVLVETETAEPGWPVVDGKPQEPEKTLDGLKLNAQHEFTQFATQLRAEIAGGADRYKLAGWANKVPRAERIVAGVANDNDMLILATECELRGKNETPPELAAKQLEKAAVYSKAAALVDGIEDAALAAIGNAQDGGSLDTLLAQLKQQATSGLES